SHAIWFWNVGTHELLRRQELATAKLERGWVNAFAYSPDGKILAAGGSLSGERGYLCSVVWMLDSATGKEIQRLEGDLGREAWAPIFDVAFLRGGRYLAAASRVHDEGSRIYVWETATGKRAEHINMALNERLESEKPRQLESWEVNRIPPSIVASPDGRLLAR